VRVLPHHDGSAESGNGVGSTTLAVADAAGVTRFRISGIRRSLDAVERSPVAPPVGAISTDLGRVLTEGCYPRDGFEGLPSASP
jgi:hypothetical protein